MMPHPCGRSSGRRQDVFKPRVPHESRKLLPCIGLSVRCSDKHVEIEQRRMLGAAAVVIKNKFLNEQKTARNERLCGLPHNIGGLVKARAVQDLGEPRHVESAGKVFGGEIPAYEGYPVGHAGVGDDAFRKGAGGGKIKDCGAQAGIVAAEMDGVGSGRAPEIKQMGTARKVNVRGRCVPPARWRCCTSP